MLQNIFQKISYTNILKTRTHIPVVALMLLALAGCSEDPAIVGNSSFVKETSEVYSKTIIVDDVRSTDQIPDYSGNLEHFSVGLYNDPELGEIEAVGMIRPSISKSYNIDTLVDSTEAKLQLVVNVDKLYGDTTSTTEVELRPISNLWRPGSWRSDSIPEYGNETITDSPIEITTEDTIEVDLPQSWLDEYMTYFNSDATNRDSVYKYNYKGMAVVAQNESKIIPFNRSGSKLMLKNEGDTAFAKLPLRSTAFGFNRSEKTQTDSTITPVVSLFDNTMILNPDLSLETLESRNMSNVELVLYENQELLNNLPVDHVRPDVPEMRIYRRTPDEVKYGIPRENRLYRVAEDSLENSYSANITSYVNQILFQNNSDNDRFSEVQFYVVPESQSGVIYGTLLYNSKSTEFQPKVLVTGAKTESAN